MSIACKDEIYIEDVLIWEMQFHSIASCSKKFLFDYLAKMYDDSYLQNLSACLKIFHLELYLYVV